MKNNKIKNNEIKFKKVYLLQEVEEPWNNASTIAVHRKTIVGETEDYYYVTSETPRRIPKSEFIEDEKDALEIAMTDKIKKGIKLSNKQKNRLDIIERIKEKHPEYFI